MPRGGDEQQIGSCNCAMPSVSTSIFFGVLAKLGAGAAAPTELATGLANDYGQLIAGDTAAYFSYRTLDNDSVFARCSTTGAITTLWSGPIQTPVIAVDETSLYIMTSERSDDGLRSHGAILALPAQR